MNETGRNVAVGLTVIVGLIFMVIMIGLFAGLPQIFQQGYEIRILFNTSQGIRPGEPIHLQGIRVGAVTDVGFTDNNPRKGVTVTGKIDSDYRLPTNIRAWVYRGMVGGPYLELKPEGELMRDPDTGEPIEFYSIDEPIVLQGNEETGQDFLPDEFSTALEDIGGAVQQMTGPEGTLAKLDKALEAFYAVMGDEENQQNLKTALRDLAAAAEKAPGVMAEVQKLMQESRTVAGDAGELTRQLITDAENLSAMLEEMEGVVRKINEGEGTAGQFLNDPQLYNNLLALTEQIDALVRDFRRLAEQWEREGVGVKLK
jgi:phospholipid/cholesterol/gamma-HCH transport system substrate-binding protein